MISLEQVRLLEEKVSKAIEYVTKVTEENKALISEKETLISKLDANQKRIDELEVLILRFKEDQGRIEDGIIAALDRLSQFEEAFQNSIKDTKPSKTLSKAKVSAKPSVQEDAGHDIKDGGTDSESKEIFFEISKNETDEDVSQEEELDIF